MIQWMLAIWSLVPLPLLKPAWTSGSSWFMYSLSLAWRILSITLLACEEIDGETVETVSDFILGGSKIPANGDSSHKIKRCLLLGRKVMTNLDGILKSRDVTLPTKVHLVKAMVFPVVMYGCESWTVKKAGHSKNWCFWTVVLEKTLESPLDPKGVHPSPTSPS